MIIPVNDENKIRWAELNNELWPHHTVEEMLAKLPNAPFEYMYFKEGLAVAFISLSLRYDYVEGTNSSPVGYIEGIYVEPAYRKTGIARELVEFAKSWSKERGCTELASDCELENMLSRSFHNRVGFSEVGINIHFTISL